MPVYPGLLLASLANFNLKCRFRPDSVVVQITEPLAGTASFQLARPKGGKPLLDHRRETAAAVRQQLRPRPPAALTSRHRRARGGERLKRKTIVYTIVLELEGVLCQTAIWNPTHLV